MKRICSRNLEDASVETEHIVRVEITFYLHA